jgi:hypothetical protein
MMKSTLIAVALAVVSAASMAQERPAPHIMLASVDAGKLVADASPEARRTRAALTRANARCNAPNGLHNQVSSIRNELVKQGAATSNAELLEGLAGVLYGANKKADCASLLAMYAVNRTSGNADMSTHTDAVIAMRALAKSGMFGVSIDDRSVKP